MPDLDPWLDAAQRELNAALAAVARATGRPPGALYPASCSRRGRRGRGVPAGHAGGTRRRPGRQDAGNPPAELAVAVHQGTLADLDLTYGALGTYVAEREIGVDGSIREHHLVIGVRHP